jgi:Tol biopolymer transport system component
MPLAPGTRLGPYEIISALGQGGMGEVYRARDTRLGRDVAVKVLPEHLSAQPEVRARFEREAKTVSSLNHPNICALYDVGKEGDVDYLVLELVDGETLEQRLARGRVPTAEALRLGAQIADALDRAHRAGVVHRDLKPSNVMLTRAGAKLMDFGLARGAARTINDSEATRALTAEGTLLGTFQYMAPEQLEGKETDARSDIWALGCVLYELFAGRRAFEGRSQASLAAAILGSEPPPDAEGVSPPGIARLIRDCLAKDPEERIQTAHDVRLQLRGIAETTGSAAPGPPARRTPMAWIAVALALTLGGTAGFLLRPADQRIAQPAVRFRLAPVEGKVESMWPRISPDGRSLLLRMTDSTGSAVAGVRRLDGTEVREIPGTRDLLRPYWSPDGKEIAFAANDKLQRVAVDGGSPIVICDFPGGGDLSWNAKGQILVDGTGTDSIRVVPAAGGAMKPASHIDRAAGELASAWPSFLPDGEHFLFIGTDLKSPGGTIRLGKLGSLDSKALGHSDGRAEWAPGNWVLFVQGSLLMAQKLDVGAGSLVGGPIQITDRLLTRSSAGHFSTSPGGMFAFARDNAGTLKLQHMSRAGVLSPSVLATGSIVDPAVSPDGRRVLYERSTAALPASGEIYGLDLDRGTETRLTFTDNRAFNPVWSPDGKRFAYGIGNRPTGMTIHIDATDGAGALDSIPVAAVSPALSEWIGARILGYSLARVWAVPTEGSARVPTDLGEGYQGRLSPDGHWLAATSGIPNHVLAYGVGSLPGRWQISSLAAKQPRWTRGGREIVFESLDHQIWAADVDTKDGFRTGTPRRLFELPLGSAGSKATWDCDANGDNFYVLVPAAQTSRGTIEVVTDFSSLVTRR